MPNEVTFHESAITGRGTSVELKGVVVWSPADDPDGPDDVYRVDVTHMRIAGGFHGVRPRWHKLDKPIRDVEVRF